MHGDMKDYEDLIQLGQIANLEEEVENLKAEKAALCDHKFNGGEQVAVHHEFLR